MLYKPLHIYYRETCLFIHYKKSYVSDNYTLLKEHLVNIATKISVKSVAL